MSDNAEPRPRWWWSRDRKWLWRQSRGRDFQRELWELSGHGRRSIHIATFVSDRLAP